MTFEKHLHSVSEHPVKDLVSWGSPAEYSMMDRFLGDAFGVLLSQFLSLWQRSSAVLLSRLLCWSTVNKMTIDRSPWTFFVQVKGITQSYFPLKSITSCYNSRHPFTVHLHSRARVQTHWQYNLTVVLKKDRCLRSMRKNTLRSRTGSALVWHFGGGAFESRFVHQVFRFAGRVNSVQYVELRRYCPWVWGVRLFNFIYHLWRHCP